MDAAVTRINSRSKGKRGELELAELLRSYGYTARRGVQFKGGVDSPDVVCEDLPWVHFECKLVEAGNPYVWLDQAERDAGDKLPIVAHRRSRREWIAVLSFDDLMLYLIGVKRGRQADERGPDSSLPSSGGPQEPDGGRSFSRHGAETIPGAVIGRTGAWSNSEKPIDERGGQAPRKGHNPRSRTKAGKA